MNGDPLTPVLTVVIPLKDEKPNVRLLHEELTRVLTAHGVPYELIVVDDGSTDGTFDELAELHRRDPRMRVVRFRRNYGQSSAFAAGFALARGRYVATFDGDLQNDPADLPRLLSLAGTQDIVCGWRKARRDAWLTRTLPSMVANRLLGLVTGIPLHDNGCSLKVFRAEVVKPLRLRPGMHRYLPALASQLGGRVVEVEVNHRPRRFGQSKYGLSRTFRVLADLLRLRALMRQAIDPQTPTDSWYEVAEVLEGAPAVTVTGGRFSGARSAD